MTKKTNKTGRTTANLGTLYGLNQKMTGDKLLMLMLKALSELYPKDKSAPGVVLAYLPLHKPAFYASMARYEEAGGGGKQILAQAYGDSVDEAARQLVVNWRAGAKTALELLRESRRARGARGALFAREHK